MTLTVGKPNQIIEARQMLKSVSSGAALLANKCWLSAAQAQRIGWTKLQIIGPHINGKNASRLLKLAEENNAQELKRKLEGENSKPTPHCILLYFTDRQYAQFEAALRREGAQRKGRGLIGKEAAIMRVIRQAGG